jgi:hypothetical protein
MEPYEYFHPDVARLNSLLEAMCNNYVAYGERAEKLAEAMVEYEKAVLASPTEYDLAYGSEDIIVRGWALVYFFREDFQHYCGGPHNVWSTAGSPFWDRVLQDRAEGRLGPSGSMTKPAKR